MTEPHLQELRLAPRRRTALLHIASHPDASNREIAAAIGVGDEAQISRLLARMRDLGLVRNRSQPDNHGGPNAWQLTVDGRRLVRALKSGARAT